ncbi:hypothetical protein Nepgr_023102 [Nepenthes gracilis]|uniref:Uncharacterized protein n=1 Tax=Nepenthes gracilis TaxID=150966 RepID=A0AAD3T0N3_NEPGR|nr:hypothetical protein Nepgr_023102 [Nepenthes gracilis]
MSEHEDVRERVLLIQISNKTQLLSICKPEQSQGFKQDAASIQPICIITSSTPTNPRSNLPQAPAGNQISAESEPPPHTDCSTNTADLQNKTYESQQSQASKCNSDQTTPERSRSDAAYSNPSNKFSISINAQIKYAKSTSKDKTQGLKQSLRSSPNNPPKPTISITIQIDGNSGFMFRSILASSGASTALLQLQQGK